MRILFKTLKWLLIIFVSLFVFIFILNISPWTFSKVKGDNLFRRSGKYPLIIPHGGAKDLAPENTVYAYDMLVNELNADVLEIDLALTKDNILITHHDLDLEMSESSPLNNEYIRDYTYNEIINAYYEDDYYLAREFKDIEGEYPFVDKDKDDPLMKKMVPAKLEDIFNEVGDDVLYILEIKDAPTSIGYEEGSDRFELAAGKLVELVETYQLEKNVVLASFSDDVTSFFRREMPNVLIGAATKEVTMFAILSAFHLDFFWNVKSEVLILPIPESMTIPENLEGILGVLPGFIRDNIALKDGDVYRANLMHKQIIKDAHRKNMAVLYWTVNDKETMRLLIENGADGIITDRPDLLLEVFEE